ncbi:hypothetical protein [Williamsia herbipolensis]|uniref:hypothetical protein n=1 Tax=Williamsia herbipolensis TaxID=1603258 RepID=UPI0005F7A709|nr:hypothetical protein [Williamsia herbipolensis]
MPQRNKGERKYVPTRILTNVDPDALARAAGYSITGQWVADLVYREAQRPDLMEGPDVKEQLPLTA